MKKYDPEVVEVGEELYKLADEIGITHALGCTFAFNISMSLPLPKCMMTESVNVIDLPNRAQSAVGKWLAMNREKPMTLERVVEMIERADEIRRFISGYGRGTERMIKQRIMEYAWSRMSTAQRRWFCIDLVDKNCYYEEAG